MVYGLLGMLGVRAEWALCFSYAVQVLIERGMAQVPALTYRDPSR